MTTGAAARWSYDELLALSSIYEAQASYARLSDAMLASTYQDLMRDGPGNLLDNYANFAPVQREIAGKEAELLTAYDQVLGAIENRDQVQRRMLRTDESNSFCIDDGRYGEAVSASWMGCPGQDPHKSALIDVRSTARTAVRLDHCSNWICAR